MAQRSAEVSTSLVEWITRSRTRSLRVQPLSKGEAVAQRARKAIIRRCFLEAGSRLPTRLPRADLNGLRRDECTGSWLPVTCGPQLFRSGRPSGFELVTRKLDASNRVSTSS